MSTVLRDRPAFFLALLRGLLCKRRIHSLGSQQIPLWLNLISKEENVSRQNCPHAGKSINRLNKQRHTRRLMEVVIPRSVKLDARPLPGTGNSSLCLKLRLSPALLLCVRTAKALARLFSYTLTPFSRDRARIFGEVQK